MLILEYESLPHSIKELPSTGISRPGNSPIIEPKNQNGEVSPWATRLTEIKDDPTISPPPHPRENVGPYPVSGGRSSQEDAYPLKLKVLPLEHGSHNRP